MDMPYEHNNIDIYLICKGMFDLKSLLEQKPKEKVKTTHFFLFLYAEWRNCLLLLMYRGPWSFIRSFPTPNMKILSPPHVPEHVKLRWGSQQRHSYLQPFHSFSRREGKKNNNNAIQATRDSSMHRPRPSQWLVPHRGNGARMHDRGGGVHTLQWPWPWCAAGRCEPSSLCRLSGHMSRA